LSRLTFWLTLLKKLNFDQGGTVVWWHGTPKIYISTIKSYCTIPIGQMKKCNNIYIWRGVLDMYPGIFRTWFTNYFSLCLNFFPYLPEHLIQTNSLIIFTCLPIYLKILKHHSISQSERQLFFSILKTLSLPCLVKFCLMA
jgi:hypothetical protein